MRHHAPGALGFGGAPVGFLVRRAYRRDAAAQDFVSPSKFSVTARGLTPLDDDVESEKNLSFWVYEACRHVYNPVRWSSLIVEAGRVRVASRSVRATVSGV